MRGVLLILAVLAGLSAPVPASTAPLDRETLSGLVVPPFSLGEPVNDQGVWQLLNSGGAEAGYVFETGEMAPIPGFSGAPINLLVTLDPEGTFVDVQLLSHNEPIFVSGLGEAPFHAFFEQYRGLSVSQQMVVGSPYGDGGGGSLVYLDGVTKATASVRIAHETILAATLAVAREKIRGVSFSPPARPNPDHSEELDWQDLLDQGLAGRLTVRNAEVNGLFAGTVWEDDDPVARDDPDGKYADLYVIDLGPPSLARAVLSTETFSELEAFRAIAEQDEPLLLIEAGRHGLVSEDFVRNTAPDLIGLSQDGLPLALRDADLYVTLSDGLPDELHDATAMILRTDRRLGFDPTRAWELELLATREHGMLMAETGSVPLTLTHQTDERFFLREETVQPAPPWLEALRNRQTDLILLAVFLTLLAGTMGFGMRRLAGHRQFPAIRLGVLAVMTVFVGWYGQGQLSVVTVLASLRAALDGGSFAFLLYDPFSALVWIFAIGSLFFWGRGFYCGWLCPFGALQAFADRVGRWLGLPKLEPSTRWDRRLKKLKYVVLAGLVATVFIAPDTTDKAAEVEPFKTAITVGFQREWYYVAWAGLWLALGMVLFKGFCRYVCPLGAVMALGGLLRRRDWIDRRAECGSPCQLCKVRCRYGSIAAGGRIDYSECFQCLDCVTIHDDPAQCVPLILENRRANGRAAA